ncbi:MAG: hypothetical protein NVSMB32_09120 [Actinomycetota bacterium]
MLDPQERRRLELSLAATEAALHRLGTASFRKSRWKVAATLLDKGITLVALGRFEEGLAACNEVLRHFGSAQDGPTQVLIAGALRYKRVALRGLGRHVEALEACAEVLRRFGNSAEEVLRDEVAAARVEQSPPTIRDAREGEADAAAAVTLRAFEQFHSLLTPAFIERFERDVLDSQSRLAAGQLIVADAQGMVVGTVTFYPEGASYPMPGWPSQWSAIRLLAVDPDARGLGLGRRLVAECVERAQRAGAAEVGLHTGPFMAAARSVYEALGFERVAEYDVLAQGAPPAQAYRRRL